MLVALKCWWDNTSEHDPSNSHLGISGSDTTPVAIVCIDTASESKALILCCTGEYAVKKGKAWISKSRTQHSTPNKGTYSSLVILADTDHCSVPMRPLPKLSSTHKYPMSYLAGTSTQNVSLQISAVQEDMRT